MFRIFLKLYIYFFSWNSSLEETSLLFFTHPLSSLTLSPLSSLLSPLSSLLSPMWQKLPYICNNFCQYSNLSITFLNCCTIEKSPIHMLLAYVSTFEWFTETGDIVGLYSRIIPREWTEVYSRQYILCCKDLSFPAQLSVWIQVTFSHICKIMHCIQLELLPSLMMLAYSVK